AAAASQAPRPSQSSESNRSPANHDHRKRSSALTRVRSPAAPHPRLESSRGAPDHGGMAASDDVFLSGRLLVAMPGIGDPHFERAVIFLCAHNAQHAMGLAVNRPVNGLSIGGVLRRLKIAESTIALPEDLVLMGGPV